MSGEVDLLPRGLLVSWLGLLAGITRIAAWMRHGTTGIAGQFQQI